MTLAAQAQPSFVRATAASAAALTVVALPMFLVGAFAPTIKDELGFGDTALGAMFSAGFLISAISLQFSGSYADDKGPTRALRLGLILGTAGALSIAVVGESYWLVLAAFLVLRIGESLVHPGTNTMLSILVPARLQGRAFGVKQAAIPLSTALAGLAVPILGSSIGWRGTFALVAVIALPTYLWIPETPPRRSPKAQSRRELWRSRHIRLISLGGALGAASVVTVSGFLTTAAEEAGFSEGEAGLILALGGVVMIASRLTWGWLADRFAFDRFAAVAMALLVGSLAYGLFATESEAGIVAGTFLVFGVGWSWPGLVILGVTEKHPNEPGGATAVVQASVRMGALISPITFGAIVESAGFRVAWLLSLGFAVAGGGVMIAGSAAARRI